METETARMHFQALLDHTRDNIYFKDIDSRFTLVSRSMAEWFGLPGPEVFVGKTDADMFAPEHAGEALADEQALIRGTKSIIRKEEKETWPDGRITWVSTVKLPLRDRDGRIIGTFGISRDITSRRRAEEELLATDARLRELESIINHGAAVVFEWADEPGWPVRYVSDNVRRFGYLPEEFLSGLLHYADLMHPDDVPRVEAAIERSKRDHEDQYVVDYRIHCRDGTQRWVEERGIIRRNEAGAVDLYQGIVLDVTDRHEALEALEEYRSRLEQMVSERTAELQAANDKLQSENERRKQSELALKDSEQRYRRLLASVTDYVYAVELQDGRPVATHHGPGCEAVTGYRPADYTGNPYLWIDMVPAEDRAAVLSQAAQVMAGRDTPPLEHRIRRKDGEVRWVRNTAVARRDAQGRLTGYDGLVKDITERRAAEEARLKMEREVLDVRQHEMMERTDQLSSLGVLATGVAHEVNNPLQGMLAHLDAVRRELPPDFPRLKSLEMVERGIESIASLVQRLLWIGSGAGEAQGACQFADAVGFVTDLLASQFQKAQIKLSVEARVLHVGLAIPHREFVQVLMNLLMNARDAMPDGGKVTLTCDVAGEEACIAVEDTGVGIAKENLARIFTPFFTTKGRKGTGLGLSVAESLVRGHRGSLTVESEPGKGSRFIIRLPLAESGT